MKHPQAAIATRILPAVRRRQIREVIPERHDLKVRMNADSVVRDAQEPMRMRIVLRHHPTQYIHGLWPERGAVATGWFPLPADYRDHAATSARDRPIRPTRCASTSRTFGGTP